MSQNENFGIMDEGYFVPRSEILSWVNNLLKVRLVLSKIHLTKIEELGSGAAYCQIIDAIHPGKVAMAKVSWKAKADYEFLNNYKILQTAFDKFGIKRYIDVNPVLK
jgi:microtubule-associated protein, RP/EB family